MFKFPLQRVLDMRAKREQEAAAHLARVREDAERAREQADELEEARSHGMRQMVQARSGGGVAVGELQNFNLVLSAMDQHLLAARRVVSQADADVQRALGAFTTASQDRRVLDRLKEKKLESWRIEAVQEDRKNMDAIALTRHARTTATKQEERE